MNFTHRFNRERPPRGILAALTVDVGVLDVDGLGGLFVSRRQSAVHGGEDLQHAFGQAGLKHHAATPHAHVLTAGVQVGNAHRH